MMARGFSWGDRVNIETNLRRLRATARIVTGFSMLLILAGAVQLALGGIAVKQEYERIAVLEELSRQNSYFGYQRQQREAQNEYNRSSSAFFMEGRFLPQDDGLAARPEAIGSLVVLGVAGLGFFVSALLWVWFAHTNLREAGVRSKYSPGLAVAGYLIPIANLMLPFEAMRELHNRSHGEPEDFAHSAVEDVTAWWTAVIVGLLIFSALMVKFTIDAGTALIIMTPLWMEFAIGGFAVLLLLGSAYLFARLALAVTAAQEELLPTIDPVALQEAAPRRPSVSIIGG